MNRFYRAALHVLKKYLILYSNPHTMKEMFCCLFSPRAFAAIIILQNLR